MISLGELFITFKQPGTYKISTKPYCDVSTCTNTEREITVLAPNTVFTVANSISGSRFIECTFGGTAGNNITYAVPAVSGATSYRWTINTTSGSGLNGLFGGSSTLVTTEPNATATYKSVSGYTQGTLRVDAFGPCGATGSRTFDLARTEPSSSVTQSGNVGCSRCFTAPNGTNYSWSLPGNQPNVYIESANGQTACIRSRVSSGVSGYLQVAYNGGCAGARLSTGTSYYISPCSGRLASGKNSPETVAETVSPNPANDLVTVTHPSGAYEVTLTDMLGKPVHRQASTSHECLIKVDRLPGGLYILQVRVGDLVHSQHRIVVAH